MIVWQETRYLKVPLSADEIKARGASLAQIVRERADELADQKDHKKAMREALAGLDRRMSLLALEVSEGMAYRDVPVELRVNLDLRLVEEVRLDTGEVIAQRTATEDDKIKAQARAQMVLNE